MKVGFVQFAVKFGDKEGNFQRTEELIRDKTADLWVLPELFNTGYVFINKNEVAALSETIPDGKTTQFLLELSKKKKSTIVAGLAEKADDKYFNSAVIVSNGEFVGLYRKIHLFYKEKLFFSPGDRKFQTWDVNGIRLGVMICFDWMFPEATRTLALNGADIICHPSNLVMPYCQNAMVTRCLENHIFAVTANRIGTEKRGDTVLEFTGGSQITGVKGEILHRADRSREEAFVMEIDPKLARDKQLNELNDLFLDRRPEFYFS
ncbi:MAG: acyltransferase [Calditrichaeota bacterium]|nr:acyltransferase [Calditrichota bacterium]